MTALTPRTTTVVLFQGDDLDPLVEKAQAVEKAARDLTPRRLGDGPTEDANSPVSVAAESFNEFMDAANERAVKVTLTALRRKAFRALLNEHPPRTVQGDEVPETHPDDIDAGFNTETFGDALVPACMSEEFGTLEQRVEFVDNISDGDFAKLYNAALSLNKALGPDPKARISWPIEPISGGISTSPARSD